MKYLITLQKGNFWDCQKFYRIPEDQCRELKIGVDFLYYFQPFRGKLGKQELDILMFNGFNSDFVIRISTFSNFLKRRIIQRFNFYSFFAAPFRTVADPIAKSFYTLVLVPLHPIQSTSYDKEPLFPTQLRNSVCPISFPVQIGDFMDQVGIVFPQYKM